VIKTHGTPSLNAWPVQSEALVSDWKTYQKFTVMVLMKRDRRSDLERRRHHYTCVSSTDTSSPKGKDI